MQESQCDGRKTGTTNKKLGKEGKKDGNRKDSTAPTKWSRGVYTCGKDAGTRACIARHSMAWHGIAEYKDRLSCCAYPASWIGLSLSSLVALLAVLSAALVSLLSLLLLLSSLCSWPLPSLPPLVCISFASPEEFIV